MAVGGVGGASSAQETNKTEQNLEDVKQSNQADKAQLDSQLDQQAKAAPAAANSAFIAQIQAQSFQVQEDQNSSAAPVDEAKKAQGQQVGHEVFNLIMQMRPSAQTVDVSGGTGAGAGGEQGSQAKSGGLGGAESNMGQADQADAQVANAAKAAVYDDIYKLLNKMQNVRNEKAGLDEKITSINQALAGHKSGDKVKVPVWEVDSNSGEVKFKGYKEMDYDKAVAMRDGLQGKKEALNEMGQEDMFWMQRFMEQKSQLEQMISNVMKAASEAQSGIAGNLKAS